MDFTRAPPPLPGSSSLFHEHLEIAMRAVLPVFADYVTGLLQPLAAKLAMVTTEREADRSRIAELEKQLAGVLAAQVGHAAGAVSINGVSEIFDAKLAALPLVSPAQSPRRLTEAVDARLGPAVAEKVADAVAKIEVQHGIDGKDGKDGVGVAGGFVDPEGNLIWTATNGNISKLCRVVGQDGKNGDRGEPGPAGKDVDPEHVRQLVAEQCRGEFDRLHKEHTEFRDIAGRDVKAIFEAEAAACLAVASDALEAKHLALIEEKFAALPPPEPGPPGPAGKDAEPISVEVIREAIREEVPLIVKGEVHLAVSALPPAEKGDPGPAGKGADPLPIDEIRAEAREHAAVEARAEAKRLVESLPRAQDGRDASEEQIANSVKEWFSVHPYVAETLIGREGELIEVLSNGSTRARGQVVGRDGKDADMATIAEWVDSKVARIPVPRDGKDGKDGKDGVDGRAALDLDDMTMEYDGERRIVFTYVRGDLTKRFELCLDGIVLDRGVYREGREPPYGKGDAVSYGGSTWIAQRDGPSIPGRGEDNGWRLSAKAGREGRAGKDFDESRLEAAEKAILELKRVIKERL